MLSVANRNLKSAKTRQKMRYQYITRRWILSLHWQHGKCQLWANCSMYWISAAHLGLQTWEMHIRHPLMCVTCLTARPCPIHHKRIGSNRIHCTQQLAEKCGKAHHRAAYTWHWSIDIMFVWRGHNNFPPCTGSSVNTHYERIVPCAGCQPQSLDPWPERRLFAIHYRAHHNHTTMTHRSKKKDWHKPSAPKHCKRQWAYRGGRMLLPSRYYCQW